MKLPCFMLLSDVGTVLIYVFAQGKVETSKVYCIINGRP
jgi:hypothetical protein